MNQINLFNVSAVAQVVISPEKDEVVAINNEFAKLIGIINIDNIYKTPESASELFSNCLPDFIVFTDELLHKKSAYSDRLLVKTRTGFVRIIAVGKVFNDEQNSQYIHLTTQCADEVERLRQESDANLHYSSGIGHWNRVNQVFQEFEYQNQLILDAVGEGIYGVDANGITTFLNPAAERILGYSAEELLGRNMHSMIHHSNLDGSHFCAKDCPIFAAFREEKTQTVEDDIFWSKSGEPIDVEYTSTPVKDNGYTVGAVVVFHDISQKKADKQRLLEALSEVQQLKNQLELENAYLQEEIDSEYNHHQIIGKSESIQHVIQQVELVADTNATVLVTGESGTGKELIARAIHDLSTRSNRRLIRVNCAAIPEDLFESEFFGHAKGSFTGATDNRPGRFEVADGGTLFLDEVAEIPLHLQGKLLRVLQEQQFERVGESKTRHVDVRIIAATNCDLKQQVHSGNFREDLYFRLNVFPIESVPLRYRLDDIALLTQHFLKKASIRANKPNLKVSMSEIEKLKAYHWPGNIRELENVIERQVILTRGDMVRFDELAIKTEPQNSQIQFIKAPIMTSHDMKQHEKNNIITALIKCHGKVFGYNGAAEMLGLKPTTLSSKIKKYQINPRQYKSSNKITTGT